MTFTEIGPAGGVVFSTDGRRVQAWRALATSGAGTGVVTATMDQTGTSYSPTISASMGAAMIEVTGTKTTGTNGADAIVQWPTNSASGVTSLTVNMAAFADSNNRPLAFFSHRADSDAEATNHDTAEGYTELHDGPHGSVMMAHMAEWHATAANTTPSADWGTSSGATGGFALEIAADSGSNTLEIWVSQGDDDAEESLASGSVDTTSSDLEIIREGSTNNQEVGLRFQNITIPQGATITNAYVEFTTDVVQSEVTNLTFHGEDVDNAAVFTSVGNPNYNITNRTKTTASVAWDNVPAPSVVGEKQQSPDLSTVIQEIVNRPGWTSGNSMVIIVSGSGQRETESWNGANGHGDLTLAPMLHLEYSDGTHLNQAHVRWRNDDGYEISETTVTYQKGDGKGSVSETDDASLRSDNPTTNYGSAVDILVDDTPDYHTVIKFPNIFGGGANQIPLGSTVTSATLTVEVYDPGTDIDVYQLTESWIEDQVTWNNRVTGTGWSNAGADGTSSHKAAADDTFTGSTGTQNIDVTTSVQNWSAGEANEGWVLIDTSSGGVDIYSSEYGTIASRPKLSVTYGSGSAATFAADEDTAITGLAKNTSRRVRFLVSNSSGTSSGAVNYQLEFAETDTCSSGSYSAVPISAGAGDKWEIVDSTYITDGEATSDIDDGVDDALPDPGGMSFVTGELRDDNSNSTGGITLDPDEFTEIEFTIQATDDALDGTDYCFRLTDSGTALNTYSAYAEATLSAGGPSWWDSGYAYREQITLTAPASNNVPNGYPVKLTIDHASLYSAGKSQQDGDDIRIVYWNGSSWAEIDRTLFNNNLTGSSWDQSDTTIMFKTQASITAGES
ncbi:MAG: DNRLRE domain-containing protein, partial [Desulfobacterales bacterium]